jgi:hypothetical protein
MYLHEVKNGVFMLSFADVMAGPEDDPALLSFRLL